ncbi:hypothetical protein HOU02_gp329 [Caulobacter phage CcrBL9]|uniref:Uncharacterized protein n=1 Tax=Caulobacter phage CcrBL9 TaxID=2283270 RepID=A0A385ECI6_9CAUD|nr:hypothetical protein HOU02_gp329 [Caulobacter phage CcrBL9]AXQ69396.1 hypothetical protein CcrBL9_gp372 [Caulobacter phage CcrBL9]
MTPREHNYAQLRMALSRDFKGHAEIRKLIKGQKLRDDLDAAEDLAGVKAVVHELITSVYGDHPWLREPPPVYEGEIKKGMEFLMTVDEGNAREIKIVEVQEDNLGHRFYNYRYMNGVGKGHIESLADDMLRGIIEPLDDEIPF